MKELINADDSNFDNLLNDEKAIIVDFWSPTCAPCKLLEPILKNIASDYNEEVFADFQHYYL
jgi:thioredoxin 1